jgi:L-ribulose-5-phosphate 4-epimerase
MFLQELREEVLEANLELARRKLALYTYGNTSGISQEKNLVGTRPSGMPYKEMKFEHLVMVDLGGRTVAGNLKLSSNSPTYPVLYQAFPDIDSVIYMHSEDVRV